MAEKRAREHKESKIKGNSLGTAGFIFGILSILALAIPGIIISLAGFIFCYVQQKNKPTKLGKAGLILNVIGFILSLIWIFYLGPIVLNWLRTLPQT